jgi:hypothetical protein
MMDVQWDLFAAERVVQEDGSQSSRLLNAMMPSLHPRDNPASKALPTHSDIASSRGPGTYQITSLHDV